MKRLGVLLAVALCLFFSTPASAQIGGEEGEILEVMAQQVKAWNDGDIEAYMEGYWKSESLRFASGGDVTHGWEATLKRYVKRYRTKRKMGTLTFSDLDVNVLTDDAAIVFGKWKLKRRHDRPWGLFTLLFKKTDDGWRIVHDHTSSGD